MLEINERKKVLKFLKNLHKISLKSEKYENAIKNKYGISKVQLKNIIDNKTKVYTNTHIKNIKNLFTNILNECSKTIMDISAVAAHDIATSDFVDIAEKLGIEKELINKAINKVKQKEDDFGTAV